jgi:hypothetical protein
VWSSLVASVSNVALAKADVIAFRTASLLLPLPELVLVLLPVLGAVLTLMLVLALLLALLLTTVPVRTEVGPSAATPVELLLLPPPPTLCPSPPVPLLLGAYMLVPALLPQPLLWMLLPVTLGCGVLDTSAAEAASTSVELRGAAASCCSVGLSECSRC